MYKRAPKYLTYRAFDTNRLDRKLFIEGECRSSQVGTQKSKAKVATTKLAKITNDHKLPKPEKTRLRSTAAQSCN